MTSPRERVQLLIWIAVAAGAALFVFHSGTHTNSGGDKKGGVDAEAVKSLLSWPQEASSLIATYPMAGLAYSNLLGAKLSPCLVIETLRGRLSAEANSVGSQASAALNEIRTNQDARCSAFTEIENEVRPFVQEIAKNGAAQQEYFVFSVMDEGDEAETWKESEIGIFRTLDDCQRAERSIHAADVPTRRCHGVEFGHAVGDSKQPPSVHTR